VGGDRTAAMKTNIVASGSIGWFDIVGIVIIIGVISGSDQTSQ